MSWSATSVVWWSICPIVERSINWSPSGRFRIQGPKIRQRVISLALGQFVSQSIEQFEVQGPITVGQSTRHFGGCASSKERFKVLRLGNTWAISWVVQGLGSDGLEVDRATGKETDQLCKWSASLSDERSTLCWSDKRAGGGSDVRRSICLELMAWWSGDRQKVNQLVSLTVWRFRLGSSSWSSGLTLGLSNG